MLLLRRLLARGRNEEKEMTGVAEAEVDLEEAVAEAVDPVAPEPSPPQEALVL